MDQLKAEKIQSQMAALVGSRESLLLASVAADGTPHASYAPTVPGEGGKYYVHVSELAKHFHNLSTDGRVSALIIEDEKDAANIFARKRLTLEGRATEIDKESPLWAEVMDRFTKKFGAFFEQSLRHLKDFHTFELSFDSGTLVLGFGSAFRLTGEELGQLDWLRGEHGTAGTGLAHTGANH
ncbi:MAG: pyridoxamine 5'-phosphate oxidase family protein [Turneriella sp.]|nr:pyridoxamine 5'-phosphate oxidase family protein [Turneriella sp.]